MQKSVKIKFFLVILVSVLFASIFLGTTRVKPQSFATEQWDVDDSLGAWHVWGSNWDVSDSILTLYPIGESILYIYDETGWEGIPWPTYDLHLGAKSIGCDIHIQAWIFLQNGTDCEDILGLEYTANQDDGWEDYVWRYSDFASACHLEGNINITELDFLFWCPAGGYDRPGWNGDMALSSFMEFPEPYIMIDYISTSANQWSDDVEDEVDEEAAAETATEPDAGTGDGNGDGAGGLIAGGGDILDQFSIHLNSWLADLEAGNTMAWIWLLIVLLPIIYWLVRKYLGKGD